MSETPKEPKSPPAEIIFSPQRNDRSSRTSLSKTSTLMHVEMSPKRPPKNSARSAESEKSSDIGSAATQTSPRVFPHAIPPQAVFPDLGSKNEIGKASCR